MENTNEILNGIVNQSIKNVICVDDDFLEPYEDVMETNKEKCIFPDKCIVLYLHLVNVQLQLFRINRKRM